MFITIFTDASFCQNTKGTGWAVWIKYGENITVRHQGGYIAKKGYHSGHAESHALEHALWMCKRLREVGRMDLKNKVVILQSDCQSALNNLDVSSLRKQGVQYIKKKWVKAHTGKSDNRSLVNNWCDVTAYAEMKKQRVIHHNKFK